ncbi:hypothetical protein T484DRAFT_1839560 [Baffinella frigidus]|nr:hypothetical protein T484DRAFT_1839560 [Cryptophyta sp. CCMP2293]
MESLSIDIEEIATRHTAAECAGEKSYVDPKTGYRVFTATTLKGRGKCCGCGCRHCPYNHANIPMEKRAALIKAPALLRGAWSDLDADAGGIDVLLWSGGKAPALLRGAWSNLDADGGGLLWSGGKDSFLAP